MTDVRAQFRLLVNAFSTLLMGLMSYYTDIPNELAIAIVGFVAIVLGFAEAVYDARCKRLDAARREGG